MKNNSHVFGERMKRLRAGKPKAAFARELGIDNPSTYQNYEDGRVPSSRIVNKIATQCGVTMEWLMGGPDNPGLAIHASAYPPATKPGSSDMMLRDAPATPPQPLCRYPADCDLVQELSAQRHAQADVQAQLATLSTQVETLTRLLGATLAASAQSVAHDKQKAG